MDIKENELIQWETSLHDKRLRLDAQTESLDSRLSGMELQKKDIGINVKQLQVLTQNYEDMLVKEQQIQEQQEFIRTEKESMVSLQQQIQSEHVMLKEERVNIETTYLDKEKNRLKVRLEKERLQMT